MRVIKLKQSQRSGVLLDVRTLKELPANGVVTCQQFCSTFDKSIKQYVLQPTIDAQKPFIQINPIGNNIDPTKLVFQIYAIEKLRMHFFLEDQGENLYQFNVSPKQIMISRNDQDVQISSSFILTGKWLSLCFDFASFFGQMQLYLKTLIIGSACKIKQIYESQIQLVTISDGYFMVQKVNYKRLQELIEQQNRCRSEDLPSRRQAIPMKRQQTMGAQRDHQTLQLPNVKNAEKLIHKNVKMATGLQVIEEIQPKRQNRGSQHEPAGMSKMAQKFIKVFDQTQQTTPQDRRTTEGTQEEFFSNVRTNDHQPDPNSFYHSRFGKFSNTFQKPLGFSSMNFKLASQNSNTFTQIPQQQTTQDYFYLSSQLQQQEASESKSHIMESQVEEKIEAEERDDFRSFTESFKTIRTKKEYVSSSEDIVVSQFV